MRKSPLWAQAGIAPQLLRETRPDGTPRVFANFAGGSWPPVIAISDDVIEQGAPPYFRHGDGIVTISAENTRVSYGLVEHDDDGRVWLGVMSPEPPV